MIIKNFSEGFTPVCLFTYETASARSRILTLDGESGDNLYSRFSDFITKWFGRNRIDNKITVKLKCDADETKFIYMTYWDGDLSIGLDVFFLNDYERPANSYRMVLVNNLKPDGV
jgi:hypothetical protein